MMDDTISRRAAIEAVQNRHYMLTKEKVLLINDIKNLPSAEPKRGKWVDDGDPLMLTCGNCSYAVMRYNNTPFCPNCGAKMEVTE